MCRRCGEPDKRGSAKDRRRRKQWLLDTFGDGEKCYCAHCDMPLVWAEIQQDRIQPGGPYARWNIQPSCGPCNNKRTTPCGNMPR